MWLSVFRPIGAPARFAVWHLALVGSLAGWWGVLAPAKSWGHEGDEKYTVDRDVVYARQDGEELLADIYAPPPAAGTGPFPGVLVVHGGAWMSGQKSQLAYIAKNLAQNGYVSMAINYRLAPKHQFPAQIEDCRASVRFMRTEMRKYHLDPERIGGFGYSAGGHLVALLGACDTAPDGQPSAVSTRLQAVVAGGAPLDFRPLPVRNWLLAYWLGGSRGEKPEAYALASPANFVSPDDPPMFFYHGARDRIVPIVSSQAMVELLKTCQVETELYTVPGAGHIAAVFNEEAWLKGLDFLDRRLKTNSASPAAEAPAAPSLPPAGEVNTGQ